jgi:hypothetical protein
MKKILLALIFLTVLATGMVFAEGNSEQRSREKYDKRGFVDRSDWLYEFNSVAAKAVDSAKYVTGEKQSYSGTSMYKTMFDDYCVNYKVLLDIGVERGFIDDRTRKQQIDKLVAERDKVSKYLAQQSSGLGL